MIRKKIAMKVLEFKRSGIRIIAEFRGFPNGFPNQVFRDRDVLGKVGPLRFGPGTVLSMLQWQEDVKGDAARINSRPRWAASSPFRHSS